MCLKGTLLTNSLNHPLSFKFMTPSEIQSLCYTVSLRIARLHQIMTKERRDCFLINEAMHCINYLGVHLEELSETENSPSYNFHIKRAYFNSVKAKYWLRLLRDTNMFGSTITSSLIENVNEIVEATRTLKKNA